MPYTKEQIRELKDAVTPLESVEWLLDHGYPIEVKGLGKKYIDIKCRNIRITHLAVAKFLPENMTVGQEVLVTAMRAIKKWTAWIF